MEQRNASPHLFELERRNVRVGLRRNGTARRGPLDLFRVVQYTNNRMFSERDIE